MRDLICRCKWQVRPEYTTQWTASAFSQWCRLHRARGHRE